MASAVEEGEEPYSPWTQLIPELLHIISQNLADDISDFIRFRCVCRSWRHAAKPSDLSPQLPWLLLPYDPESSIRSFFSIADESTRTLLLPETLNQNICGSSNGWLIMHDKALKISLFNPITRSLIRLPPITAFPGDEYLFLSEETFAGDDVRVVHGGDEVTLKEMPNFFECSAFIYPNPESVDAVDGVVAFMLADAPQIQYCKLGDAGWTVIDTGLGWGIKTMAFHHGYFYFVDSDGRSSFCELGPVKKEAVMIPPVNPTRGHSCLYLVTSPEELLLVSCNSSCNDMFEYHKLEVGSGETMAWLRIGGAVDSSVFLADGSVDSKGRLMNVASRAPGYRTGRAYFVVPPMYMLTEGPMQVIMVDGGDIGQYNGPWTEWKPPPVHSLWIVPSLF